MSEASAPSSGYDVADVSGMDDPETGDKPMIVIEDEAQLDTVQITPEHIRGNGTLHSTPFEGIAELIDNAVDSGARMVSIEDRQTKVCRYITVTDDGAGMNRTEALKTIMMGHSLKRGDTSTIGQFGNGLKSGSMRLGGTMLLCTKKDGEFTVLMLSLPFMDTVKDQKCYVPIVCYKQNAAKKFVKMTRIDENEAKHDTSLERILQYSPFKTEDALHDFLNKKLNGPSGTTVAIRDLHKMEDGNYEMKLDSICNDLMLPNRVAEEGKDRYLSSFLQTLYIDPKIVIQIQNRQVRLLDVRRSLAYPRWMWLDPSGMDCFRRRQKERIMEEHKKKALERGAAQSKLNQAANKVNSATSKFTKQNETDRRQALMLVQNLDAQMADLLARASKIDKNDAGGDIRVHCGIDVKHRGRARIVAYSNGRRILTQPLLGKREKDPVAKFKAVMGVVVIVDIPSTLLPTNQNREKFEIPAEWAVITKKLGEHAKTYFAHADKKYKTSEFWGKFGYETTTASHFDAMNPHLNGVQELLFEQSGGRRQCARCHEFRTTAYRDARLASLEDTNFVCVNTRSCGPKTDQELEDEEIKQLNVSGKPSYYDNEDPAVAAADKKKKKEEAVKSADNNNNNNKRKSAAKSRRSRHSSESDFIDDGDMNSAGSRDSTPPAPARRSLRPRADYSPVSEAPEKTKKKRRKSKTKKSGGAGRKTRSSSAGFKIPKLRRVIDSDPEDEIDKEERDNNSPPSNGALVQPKVETLAEELERGVGSAGGDANNAAADVNFFDDDPGLCDDNEIPPPRPASTTVDQLEMDRREEMRDGSTGASTVSTARSTPRRPTLIMGEERKRRAEDGEEKAVESAKKKRADDIEIESCRSPASYSMMATSRSMTGTTLAADDATLAATFTTNSTMIANEDTRSGDMTDDTTTLSGGATVGGPPVRRLAPLHERVAAFEAMADGRRIEELVLLQEALNDAQKQLDEYKSKLEQKGAENATLCEQLKTARAAFEEQQQLAHTAIEEKLRLEETVANEVKTKKKLYDDRKEAETKLKEKKKENDELMEKNKELTEQLALVSNASKAINKFVHARARLPLDLQQPSVALAMMELSTSAPLNVAGPSGGRDLPDAPASASHAEVDRGLLNESIIILDY